jgi:hypothetical protein
MSEFTVEFRIRCEAEFADSVTSHMGLKASHERYYEDKFIWGYDGTDKYDEPVYWNDLEEGLNFVMTKLESKLEIIRSLSKQHECIWWCGHFLDTPNEGSILSSHCLKRMAEFGIDYFLDTYCR